VEKGVGLFESLLVFENYPAEMALARGEERRLELRISQLNTVEKTNYPLTVVAASAGGIVLRIGYDQGRFDEWTIRRMMGHLQAVLESFAANPEQPLKRVSLLTVTERQQLLVEWNQTQRDFPERQCLHELFEKQVERTPEAPAVVYEGRELSYGELNQQANILANYLRESGVGPEVVVGLCLERSLEMVVALLGVLKAGGAYLPLDPDYPAERLAWMMEDAQAAVLLTQAPLRENWSNSLVQIICLDSDWERIAAAQTSYPGSSVEAENLAYIIYTSGSTGKPKGVMVEHRNITNLMWAVREQFGFRAGEVMPVIAPYVFDIFLFELFAPLVSGGTAIIISGQHTLEVQQLIHRLRQATRLHTVPALMQQIVDYIRSHRPVAACEQIGEVFVGGDVVPPRLLAEMQEAFPQARRQILYGPTEGTLICSSYEVAQGCEIEKLIIGKPLANMALRLYDQEQNLVPVGVAGEIYIGGRGVSRGYLRREALTNERYVELEGERYYRTGDVGRYLPDGNIEYLGRIDQQVKIRGYRIEPGEIEAALGQHPEVRAAAVIVSKSEEQEGRLVAYIVTQPKAGQAENGRPTEQDHRSGSLVKSLRDHLSKYLPAYMAPARFVFLEKLPLTVNGKIDRQALPALGETRPELEQCYLAPRTPVEEGLAEIWADVLRLEKVGIADDFFELGGHSLLAVQVISRIAVTFLVEIPLRRLFESPTVSGLAQSIEEALKQGQGLPARPPLKRRERTGKLPLSFAQQRLWFLEQLEPGGSAYNLPSAVLLSGELKVEALEQTLSELVRRHEALRTSFPVLNGEAVQSIAEPQPVTLPVVDLSGLSQEAREQTAKRLANEEGRLPFDLKRGPLLRVNLLRLGRERHLALLTMHHIVSDAWSTGVLIQEVAALYSAFSRRQPSPLSELSLQYADYALWQREYLQGEVLERQLEYWRKQLEGLEAIGLPYDKPMPDFLSPRVESLPFDLTNDLTTRLKALSRYGGGTLFMTLLAGLQVLLSHFSARADVVVGVSVANRNHSEIENLIGFFINQLALRTNLNPVTTFKDCLHQARATVLQALAHQDLPFERLVDELAPAFRSGKTAIYEVKLVLQNAPQETLELPGLQVGLFGIHSPALRCPIYIELSDTVNGLRGVWQYSHELFEPSTILILIEQLKEIYSIVSQTPEIKISALYQKLTEIKVKHQERYEREARENRSKLWKAVRQSKGEVHAGQAAVRISLDELVSCATLEPGQSLPLVMYPAMRDLDLPDLARHNKKLIEEKLRRWGAILFRGFRIESVSDFHRFAVTLSGELMPYDEPTTPRSLVGDNIYTSTDYPADQAIPLHNERSYSLTVPQMLYFWCQLPPETGGRTPLCDSRKVWERIDPSVQKKFLERGWMYVRNFSDELGLPWQAIFQSGDRAVVEEYCRRNGIAWEWRPGGKLTTRQIRPAVIEHPVTHEMTWFNHIAFFHVSTLKPELREILLINYGEENLPNNTYYGDGSPIEDEIVQHLREVYDQEAISFPWQKGDLVLIDNLLTAHGRTPYAGPRKILFAMAEPYSR
jgi:amino acid adenylation domain-containing protein